MTTINKTNKSLNEKMEDEEDYKIIAQSDETLDIDKLKSFAEVCEECGIDYNNL